MFSLTFTLSNSVNIEQQIYLFEKFMSQFKSDIQTCLQCNKQVMVIYTHGTAALFALCQLS